MANGLNLWDTAYAYGMGTSEKVMADKYNVGPAQIPVAWATAKGTLPVIVVGTMVNDKPTWTLAAHAGTVAHSHLMVSLVQATLSEEVKTNEKNETCSAYSCYPADSQCLRCPGDNRPVTIFK